MPLWQIYHPPGTFEDASSKESFAKDITQIYTSVGLPAFYVVVQYHKIDNHNVFIGGDSLSQASEVRQKPFIRLVVDHIAVRLPDDDALYARTTTRIDSVLRPHLLEKGFDYEYHVDETERRLWKINGLIPPPHKSSEERVWFEENRPLPWDGAYPAKTLRQSL
ncbi:hypothetical protein POX_f07630 [Penicillium oxalicum]|uniref:Tautomerase cis-CaaD-like domain-containing protein n=1 Tax=Penicillium oxalicum (strain 114-2 / CGMCC 5302) TaxID=933388 RepID=S7ZIM3_PENO1|nr:hypothetical protein POX_f07630 [Penicillium oxalicum]EPS28546.1 hypothetical protein PDE_03492 [Penicillium oxalicum 114-2]KAI2787267.1 hypothetical protein POX_f07630 [Penicillium oxalicum]